MNSTRVIQQIFHQWSQKRFWNLHTYDPVIIGKIFYDRGHYLSAYRWFTLAGSLDGLDDRLGDHGGPKSFEKLKEIPFQLDDPPTSLQKYLEYLQLQSCSSSNGKYWLIL